MFDEQTPHKAYEDIGASNPPTVITAVHAGSKSLLEPVKLFAIELGQH